ncbi:hypothetical protein ACROYT_G008084 [Oculina patagonica]
MKRATVIFALIAGIIAFAEANCGIRPAGSRIVGGEEAVENSWPWQAMLMSSSNRQFCGGSLIDPSWVLTAAHCVNGASPSQVRVRMGAHYRVSGSLGTEQDFDVATIHIHERYNPKNYRHDVALLKLARPALIGQGVDLVCMPDAKFPLPFGDHSKKCFITGWGTLSSGGSQPNELMQATVPLVSKTNCSIAYRGKIHDSMLCAGLDQGGVDACQGDSGGPLVCEFNGRFYLEGATSWGYGCAMPNKYGVYAKIRYLSSWVNSKMGISITG